MLYMLWLCILFSTRLSTWMSCPLIMLVIRAVLTDGTSPKPSLSFVTIRSPWSFSVAIRMYLCCMFWVVSVLVLGFSVLGGGSARVDGSAWGDVSAWGGGSARGGRSARSGDRAALGGRSA